MPSMCMALMRFKEANYFRGEPIRRTKVDVRVGKLKNGKVTSKDEVARDDKRWWW